MSDETTTTNPPIQPEPTPRQNLEIPNLSEQAIHEPTLQDQETPLTDSGQAITPSSTSSEPVQTSPTVMEAPKTETTSESTNMPASSPSGETVTEPAAGGVTISPEPVIADKNGPIEVAPPASALPSPKATEGQSESFGEARPATEISTPHQNSEIPNLGGQAVDLDTAHTTPITIAPLGLIQDYVAKAAEALRFRRRKKLNRLMVLFGKQKWVTNDDVEKFVHVSNSTATNYLNLLEKEGKIESNNKKGNAGAYTLST